MLIGTQLKYKDTDNSPVFQTVKEPNGNTVECICIDNGPLNINTIIVDITEMQVVDEEVTPRYLV